MQLGGLEWVARFTCQAVVRLVVLREPRLGQFVFAPHGISFHPSVDTLGFFTWLSHGPKSITFSAPDKPCLLTFFWPKQVTWVYGSSSQVARQWRIFLPVREMQVRSLGREASLQKEMATHCSIPAQETPWTEVPSRAQFKGLQMNHAWLSGLNVTKAGLDSATPTLFLCSCPSQNVVMWIHHRVITRVTEYVIS